MQSRKFRFQACVALSGALVFSVAATVAHAGETCKDSAANSPCQGTNSPCVCVKRADLNDPEEITDVSFNFTDPDNPVITLKTGSSTYPWTVWSQEHATDTDPDAIGEIRVDYSGSDDFRVIIANGANAGATNVADILLIDGGFTGYSTIEGSEISGNLTGDVTVQDESTVGGTLDLIVGGGVSGGTITAYIVTKLETGDDLDSDLLVEDEISVLDVGGDLNGDVGSKPVTADIVDMDVAGSVTGDVWASDLDNLYIPSPYDLVGNLNATDITYIFVGDDVSGHVTATTVDNLTIGGDLTATGELHIVTLADDLLIGNDCNGKVYVTTEMEAASLIDVGGDMSAYVGNVGLIDVESMLSGSAIQIDGSVGVGQSATIDVASLTSASVTIDAAVGHAAPGYVILGTMTASSLTVKMTVGTGGYITIGSMASSGATDSSLEFNETSGDFAGDLELTSGVAADQTVYIHGELMLGSSIDFDGDPVAGTVTVYEGGPGTVSDGGAVTGTVLLAVDTHTYSGTATFSAVNSGGTVGTEVDDAGNTATLSGTINVTGTLAGTVEVGALSSGGDISVSTLTGGKIASDEDVYGDIVVTNGATGANGKIDCEKGLRGAAEIQIGGMCDIAIWIANQTDALTRIELMGGLDEDGTLIINRDEGDHDAGGAIQVGNQFLYCPGGPTTPPAVTFDGNIMIAGVDEPGGGGDLNGGISVWGCHATDDDLDICICGGDGAGNVSLYEDTCTYPCRSAVEVSCVTGC